MANKNLLDVTMHLFGMPYQFPNAVDPVESVVHEKIGKKFAENIILEAPICTIIPGGPNFLAGKSQSVKETTASVLMNPSYDNARNLFRLSDIFSSNTSKQARLYDFKPSYNLYMSCVNLLCRTGAVLLEINDHYYFDYTDSGISYQEFDWRAYRFNRTAEQRVYSKRRKQMVGNKGKNIRGQESTSMSEKLTSLITNYNYVQFYVDPDVNPADSISNATNQSMFKSLFDQGSGAMKEFTYLVNSGGGDNITRFLRDTSKQFNEGISAILGKGKLAGALGAIINTGSEVLQGNNVIMPAIYQSSEYSKQYALTVHLKTPYGTKLGYYLDIFVPMMHLLALAMPRQASANSYGSPFLIKAYVDGMFSCNMGIVDSIQISRVNPSLSVQGLPTEVDVTLNITDLYSDLTMTVPNQLNAMYQFINNSSLIEFLAVNTGLDLTAPQIEKKWEMFTKGLKNQLGDALPSIKYGIQEGLYNQIAGLTKLYN